MISVLNRFQARGSSFKEQKRNVILQFVCFESAFFFLFFMQLLFVVGSDLGWSDFAWALMNCTSHVFISVLPSLYMLANHLHVFRKQL